ncbi:hypothetical protein EEB14_52040 [Rhodococcus sp. WS4]|nr:hypothetical protein EEB14_52040 [Rhodococcus sp. WS4]
MKAAVIETEGGSFLLRDVEIDSPTENEVLVRVEASGLCHSDLHMAAGGFGIPLPAVFGHELAGVVESVGPQVVKGHEGVPVGGQLVSLCADS